MYVCLLESDTAVVYYTRAFLLHSLLLLNGAGKREQNISGSSGSVWVAIKIWNDEMQNDLHFEISKLQILK